jgi:hypothetical protein
MRISCTLAEGKFKTAWLVGATCESGISIRKVGEFPCGGRAFAKAPVRKTPTMQSLKA